MGKRKERRLAALSNAGRRVKLDLFAEPSGDVVGTSRHDEVKLNLDQNHGAGVPNSPSSDKKSENPLLLLGQYSDEEFEEKETKSREHVSHLISSNVPNEKEEELMEANGTIDHDGDKAIAAAIVEKSVSPKKDLDAVENADSLGTSNIIGSDANFSRSQHNSVDLAESVLGTSGVQVVGDVTGGWKLVMHEESNRCYYWNTVTGETSWDEPNVLVQEAENGSAHVLHHAPVTNLTIDQYVSSDVPADEGQKKDKLTVDNFHECIDRVESVNGLRGVGESETLGAMDSLVTQSGTSVAVDELCRENSELHDSLDLQNPDANNLKDGKAASSDNPFSVSCPDEDVPSQLLKYGEALLQRLKELQGCFDWSTKYIMEVEIRLSDCKALSSYGSTLLPFWWHSEAQLKRLESAVHEEVSLVEKSEPFVAESGEGISNDLVVETESETVDSKKDLPCIVGNAHVSQIAENASHPSNELQNEIAASTYVVSNIAPTFREDVDMEVDMDVEDQCSTKYKIAEDASGSKQLTPGQEVVHLNRDAKALECASSMPTEELSIPPPPDDEWIPPPPPDNEPPPPPPPDDFPTQSYPLPSYSETHTSLPYAEQYNLAYSGPTYEYYASTLGDVSSASYYMPPEGLQVVETQPPTYYESVANLFPETDPALVNPVGSTIYYEHSNASVAPGSVVSSLGPSQYYSEPSTSAYHSSASNQPTSDSVSAKCASSESPHQEDEQGSKLVCREPDTVSNELFRTAATVDNEITHVAPSATTSTTAKNQSKVARSKKRSSAVAPTLRSNKKVSNLVDKWKAAKEELHAEEEPENPYEMLERKRQREIEEWRAQQIASGEALDNANFQPLGGDWRERVKRRRAESGQPTIATVETSPGGETQADNEQPDLEQLSKLLPSGWQAYWDESSKRVYYGNLITSETTWTKPT